MNKIRYDKECGSIYFDDTFHFDDESVTLTFKGVKRNDNFNLDVIKENILKTFDGKLDCYDLVKAIMALRLIFSDFNERTLSVVHSRRKDCSSVNYCCGEMDAYLSSSDHDGNIVNVKYKLGEEMNFSMHNRFSKFTNYLSNSVFLDYIKNETKLIERLGKMNIIADNKSIDDNVYRLR